MLKRVLFIVLLACLSSVAWGQDFGLDLGCCSDPLTGIPVFVNGHGGGTHDYFNSTDSAITELSFLVNAGTTTITDLTCNPYNFFTNCTITQNGNFITFDFHTSHPLDEDELFGFRDPETGPSELEGLPTLMDGCQGHPDSGNSNSLPLNTVDATMGVSPCSSRGHFLISFNHVSEGHPVNDPNGSGEWATDGSVSASLATVNGLPVPEPSSLFAAGLLLIGVITRRCARQRA